MSFLINILSTFFNKFISKSNNQTNNSNTNINVTRQENTNVIAEATAAILWICALALAIYWIPQYIVANIFWVKDCISQGHLVDFPIKADELFKMIYSLLGLGIAGVMHTLVKKLYLGRKNNG